MKAFELTNVSDRITVINNYDTRCDRYIDRSDYVVILGNGYKLEKIIENFNWVSSLVDKQPIYVCCYADMLFVDYNSLEPDLWHTVSWFQSQYITATFQLFNNNRYVVTTGGVKPTWHNWDRFRTNMAQTLVHDHHGKSWYSTYDGRFGFVISSSGMPEGVNPQHALSLDVNNFENETNLCIIDSREHRVINLPIKES